MSFRNWPWSIASWVCCLLCFLPVSSIIPIRQFLFRINDFTWMNMLKSLIFLFSWEMYWKFRLRRVYASQINACNISAYVDKQVILFHLLRMLQVWSMDKWCDNHGKQSFVLIDLFWRRINLYWTLDFQLYFGCQSILFRLYILLQ